jgi:hypothetical protein
MKYTQLHGCAAERFRPKTIRPKTIPWPMLPASDPPPADQPTTLFLNESSAVQLNKQPARSKIAPSESPTGKPREYLLRVCGPAGVPKTDNWFLSRPAACFVLVL